MFCDIDEDKKILHSRSFSSDDQSMASADFGPESCIPLSGSLSGKSSIDISVKSSLSSCLTGTNSGKNSIGAKISGGTGTEIMKLEAKSREECKNGERASFGKNRLSNASCSSVVSIINESIYSVKISEGIGTDVKKKASMKPPEGRKNAECGSFGKNRFSNASYCSVVSESNESICSSTSSAVNKPHKANDVRWEAVQGVRARVGDVGLSHFRLLKRLGCGDIGSVYLSELRGSSCYFAMKVMDKGSLASRKKLIRAQTEREILQMLDHPFLPTLYAHFETDKFSCLVMEFCSGGDLHTLRQRQQGKHFLEQAAKFYAAEVLLALEYLHVMGIVYRDLKPENVLVREDGHIMLSDFDLSLRCAVNPTLVKSTSFDMDGTRRVPAYCVQPVCMEPACVIPACIAPPCIRPDCFLPKFFPQRFKKCRKPKVETGIQAISLPELVAEPTGARSMSFVGTHEYLAPEIIRGDGHGSAVDWWTFGIFLYELLHGITPFKGAGNRATLFNVVGQPLKFPEFPIASFSARDLIRGLLVKDPQHRLASKRGATEIKQHPFFEDVNWALIRSMLPPDVPKPFELDRSGSKSIPASTVTDKKQEESNADSSGSFLDFDFF